MNRWRAGARRAWRRLRATGLRGWLFLERDTIQIVVKITVAATLAWWLADVVLGSPIPALAGLAAILTVQVTVKQTLARALQYTVGVTAGVAATVLVARVLGVHAWSVGLVIFAALLAGRILRLGTQSNQVAISALLVLSLGSGYGWIRVTDTLVGVAIGIAVNMLVAPPTYVQAASSTLSGLAEDLAVLLAEIGDGLSRRWDEGTARYWLERAREIDAAIDEGATAVERGADSIAYNPLARAEAESVARLTEAHEALDHAASQVRGIARALLDLARHAGPEAAARVVPMPALADLLRRIGEAVVAFGRLQADDPAAAARLREDRDQLCRAREAACRDHDEAARRMTDLPDEHGEDGRLLASMLVDAERLLHEVDPDAGAHTGALPTPA